MKISELRAKNEKELMGLLKETQNDVKKSVSDLLLGKSKDTSKTKKIRKSIAQIKVVLGEKKIISEQNLESVKG